jgi:hypothetical protein
MIWFGKTKLVLYKWRQNGLVPGNKQIPKFNICHLVFAWCIIQLKENLMSGVLASRTGDETLVHWRGSQDKSHLASLIFTMLTKTKSLSDDWANTQRGNKPDLTNNNKNDDETWLKTQNHEPVLWYQFVSAEGPKQVNDRNKEDNQALKRDRDC